MRNDISSYTSRIVLLSLQLKLNVVNIDVKGHENGIYKW